jgi:putative membrane protein
MTRRLHPVSVPYRAAATVSQLAWVLVIASVGSASAGIRRTIVFGVLVGGLTLALAYQALYYRRFEYELTEETLDIRSGVLGRRAREIPYHRIQNVDVSRNVVHRLLGIAAVDVETAGGGETEASLRYVDETEATRLQQELGSRGRGEEAVPTESADPLFELAPRELLLLGTVSLDLRFVSALFVLVTIAAPGLADRLGPMPGSPLVAAPFALVGLYLAAAAVGGLASAANYYGFRLWRIGDELRYERGLVQRFSGTVPLEKVQRLTIEANALARALGYATLAVETAGYAPGDEGRSAAVPIAERERVLSLARSIEPFDDVTFERPPSRARTRYGVRYALVLGLLAGLLYAAEWLAGFRLGWYLPLVLLPLVPVAAHVAWRHRGYALLDDHFVARNGFWVETITVVPYYRVQNVMSSATVFQRRRDLATLTVDTAGSSGLTGSQPRAIDVDAERAAELREAVAERLQGALGERRARRTRRLERSDAGQDRGTSPG